MLRKFRRRKIFLYAKREIGIYQSGASRLVQDAVKEGYLDVVASAEDGRQRQVTLTSSGIAVLQHAREWQSTVFLSLTIDWPVHEREAFASSLEKLLKQSRKDFPL
jgi:DNA-binding MarR family transcriptional regulator